MAILGLIFIGLLFGILLSGIVVVFIVIRSGGPLKESLFGDNGRLPAFSRAPKEPEVTPEANHRQQILIEENRVMQRLLDQSRVEREEQATSRKKAEGEIEALRGQLADRTSSLQELEEALRQARTRQEELLVELGARSEELARARLELKDAVVALEVTTSGESFTTQQIDLLQKERDELAALLDELRSRRQVSRPLA